MMSTGHKKSTAKYELMQHVKLTLTDDEILATPASQIAEIVANKTNDRLSQLQTTL